VANSLLFRSDALEAITLPERTVVARIFNQSNSFFPDDFFEMTGGMARLINATIAFQADCRFPQNLLVLKAAGSDSVNVVRLEFWRLVHRRNILNGAVVVLFNLAESKHPGVVGQAFSRTIRSSVTIK